MTDILDQVRDLLTGLKVTLSLCGIIWVTGIVVGSLLGMAASRQPRIVGRPLRAVSRIVAAIPALVILFWAHYPLQQLLAIVVPPFATAAATLAVVNSILVADVVWNGIEDLPQGYYSAALVSGLSRNQIARFVQFPLILRAILPTLVLLQVAMLHATLLASFISVDEIFRSAQQINAQRYEPVVVYSLLAGIILVVCLPLQFVASHVRNRNSLERTTGGACD